VFSVVRQRQENGMLALCNELRSSCRGSFLRAVEHYRAEASVAGGAVASTLPHTNLMKESRPALA
jgi:hypothetical protein